MGENIQPKHIPQCPMCCESDMEEKSIGNTEIWVCPRCPCVCFEYHDIYNLQDLMTSLGHPQLEQV